MKENFSEMTKKGTPKISGQKKWGIVGIIFVLIIGICFIVGIGFSPKQEIQTTKPFTAFGENMAKIMKTSITLNYAFTSDMKFSVYHVGKEKITNIDIQPSCYAIHVKKTKETIITFSGLIKGEEYIFVKEPYNPKFPEIRFTF